MYFIADSLEELISIYFLGSFVKELFSPEFFLYLEWLSELLY